MDARGVVRDASERNINRNFYVVDLGITEPLASLPALPQVRVDPQPNELSRDLVLPIRLHERCHLCHTQPNRNQGVYACVMLSALLVCFLVLNPDAVSGAVFLLQRAVCRKGSQSTLMCVFVCVCSLDLPSGSWL